MFSTEGDALPSSQQGSQMKSHIFDEFIRFQWSTLRRQRSPSANKLVNRQLNKSKRAPSDWSTFTKGLEQVNRCSAVVKENVQLWAGFTPSAALMSHSVCLQMTLMRCVMTKMIRDAWCCTGNIFTQQLLRQLKCQGEKKKKKKRPAADEREEERKWNSLWKAAYLTLDPVLKSGHGGVSPL